MVKDLNGHFSEEDTNKHKKRHSTSLVIREMQFNATVRYNFTPIKMA